MENINWLDEVVKRQDELFEDLFRLLRIDSVRDDEQATPEAPVGPGPKAALEEFLGMAKEDGFETEQFGPWAGHIKIGEGDQILGILGHLDVVPVGTGWDTDPFEPVVKDNRIYARGASDDKGPTIGAYFAIKLLRELGVEFNQRIHLIVGTDEESGWQDMDYYFQHAPMPDYGFSPDANFPIINGEKGNVSANFKFKLGETKEGDYHLLSFDAGLRANMVPQDAKAVIETEHSDQLKTAFLNYVEELGLPVGQAEVEGNTVTLDLTGKASHGAQPENGLNAATYLAFFLNRYDFDQVGAAEFIQFLAEMLHDDTVGEKIGVAITDDVMGALSQNVGIVKYNLSDGGFIDANYRYPKGTNAEIIEDQIKDRLLEYQTITLSMTDSKEPHYVSADDPMVKILLDVYTSQTGLEGHEQVIGGGTFGRLMPRGVAYGAMFPDSIDTMHQANEFIAIDDLLRATAIYAEAIYRLTR